MKLNDFLDQARLFVFIPMRLLYIPFMLCPIKRNKVVFSNFNGRGYGCNPKYVCEALLRSNRKLDLVWLTSGRGALPHEVRNVSIKSFRALWELATAKVWVCNNRLPYYVAKKKSQFYVHTWHGCLGFKKIEKDIHNQPLYYIMRSKHDSKMINVLTMNSRMATEYFRHCFYYDGPIIEKGTPRNDILVNRDTSACKKVRDYFGLTEDTKILIYPPTFRQSQDTSIYNLPFGRIMAALESRYGGKWITLVRLHPVVASKAGCIAYSPTVLNASGYDDMQELLCASDFMINDFSSGLIDFILSKKPAVFYAPDFEEYHKNDREEFLSVDTLPCPLTKTEDEMIQAISHFDEDGRYANKLDEFFKFVGLNETGRSSEIVAQLILDNLKI